MSKDSSCSYLMGCRAYVQKAREVFNIPEDFEVGVMIAIRYQDTRRILPESLIQKTFTPRQRKPLSEIAFIEELGDGIKCKYKR